MTGERVAAEARQTVLGLRAGDTAVPHEVTVVEAGLSTIDVCGALIALPGHALQVAEAGRVSATAAARCVSAAAAVWGTEVAGGLTSAAGARWLAGLVAPSRWHVERKAPAASNRATREHHRSRQGAAERESGGGSHGVPVDALASLAANPFGYRDRYSSAS